MTVENAIYTQLTTATGLSALVSTRVYAGDHLPQQVTYPAISYLRSSEQEVHAMGADPGIARAVFYVSVWGDSFDSTVNAGVELRTAINRLRGTVSSVEVLDVFKHGSDGPFYEPEAEVYHLIHRYEIIHRV